MSVETETTNALLTIDELSRGAAMTVRTTRYYTTRGMLPPPIRRGRIAYYGPTHVARLDLIRALQEHGFTLAAIEKYVKRLSIDASVEDLAIQRVMLTSWSPSPADELTREQVEERAGLVLSDDQFATLVKTKVLADIGGRYVIKPGFDVSIELLDFDLPVEGVIEAGDAIERHMTALADELTAITKRNLVAPYRSGSQGGDSASRLEADVTKLRILTQQAIVSGFQRAANNLIQRALTKD